MDPKANSLTAKLAESLASQNDVSQVISPVLSVNISPSGECAQITDKKLLKIHENHIHVGVRPAATQS